MSRARGAADDSEQRIRCLHQEQHQLSVKEDDIEQALSSLDEEMDICFASGKDELARKLVKRKLEAQFQLKRVAVSHRAGGTTLAELQTAVAEHHTHLDIMRQKAELLLERNESGASLPGRRGEFVPGECTIKEEDVELAFIREQQRRSQS